MLGTKDDWECVKLDSESEGSKIIVTLFGDDDGTTWEGVGDGKRIGKELISNDGAFEGYFVWISTGISFKLGVVLETKLGVELGNTLGKPLETTLGNTLGI